jgi:YegS/Rv2252/BmrU family lipid kinase
VVEEIKALQPDSETFDFIDIRQFGDQDLVKYDVLVAIGGDGTVNYVASVAKKQNKTLGIIPKGSGDGLARFLNIPKNTKQALQIILAGKKEYIDTADLSGEFFINVAGTGFEAKVAHRFGKEGIRGLWGYIRTTIKVFGRHQEREVILTVDGEKVRESYFSLSIANGSQWGNNFEIASAADITDGKLDVAVMKKPRLHQIPLLISHLKNKSQRDNQLFTYYKASQLDIKKSGKKWHIDGEPIKLKSVKHISVQHKSLQIMIP